MYCSLYFYFLTSFTDELEADITEILLNARQKGYTIKVRISKILFCGVSGAGKTSFINLLLKNKFQKRHISTDLTKPHQVMPVGKLSILLDKKSSNVELSVLDLDEEIDHFKKMLRQKKFTSSDTSPDDTKVAVEKDKGKVLTYCVLTCT